MLSWKQKITMVLIIKKNESKKEIETLLAKREKSNIEREYISKHFGKLKRNIDGLEYQMEIRKNED